MILEEDVQGHEEAQGENYFVSMTDMMVGMLFIFIILLMSFALLFRQQTDKQLNKIEVAEEVGQRLDQLQKRISQRLGQLRKSDELRAQLLLDLKKELSARGLTVEITPASDVLRLTDSSVNFDFRKSDLVGKYRENVRSVGEVLAKILPRYLPCSDAPTTSGCVREGGAIETIFIEGHTDRRGEDTLSGRQENWRLSTERAVITFRELIDAAPRLDALANNAGKRVLSVSAYASSRPINAAEDAKNRRIDLRFVMETDATAGLNEMDGLLKSMQIAIEQLKGAPP